MNDIKEEQSRFIVSLEQIEDQRILEALQRECRQHRGVRAKYFWDKSDACKNCIITGLIIADKKAIILCDDESDMRIVYFSELNLDIIFDFGQITF